MTKRIGEELEERCLRFAHSVRAYLGDTRKTPYSIDDSRQIARSSASIGANYIEANEGFSKKDFLMRIRIVLKEARETRYWLRLIVPGHQEPEQQALLKECEELILIFGAILRNTLKK